MQKAPTAKAPATYGDAVLASTPCFEVRCVAGCIAVVRFRGKLAESTWPQYAAAYQQLYAVARQFVLVFDMRQMGFPPIGLLQAKVKMLQTLKARTSRQVMGAVVLADSTLLTTFVSAIVRASGQVTPFYATTDVAEAASLACKLTAIAMGCRRAPLITQSATPLRWADVSPSCAYALAVMSIIRVVRHLMRERSRLRGLRYLQ